MVKEPIAAEPKSSERDVTREWLRVLSVAGQLSGKLDVLRKDTTEFFEKFGLPSQLQVVLEHSVVDIILDHEDLIRSHLRMVAVLKQRQLNELIAKHSLTREELTLLGLDSREGK